MLKLHLDTDIGGDIDDLCALAMVLNWPDADLLAVTTNQDNSGRRAGYARYALRLAGRDDIPVAAGADALLDCYRIYPGLPDEAVYWPEPIPPAPDLARSRPRSAPAQHRTGRDHRRDRRLHQSRAAGEALSRHLAQRQPRSHGRAMCFRPGRATRPGATTSDWNVQNDIGSAQTVIERSNPILVPLTVTVETALRRAHLPALHQSGPLAQLIARQAEAFAIEYGNEAQYGQTCAGSAR